MSVLRLGYGQVAGQRVQTDYVKGFAAVAEVCTFCSTYIPVDAEVWFINGSYDQYCSRDCAMEDDLTG